MGLTYPEDNGGASVGCRKQATLKRHCFAVILWTLDMTLFHLITETAMLKLFPCSYKGTDLDAHDVVRSLTVSLPIVG